ncbi:MAG: hypothetical protein RML94_00105 [Bacteroidia bacterium]|nr:hypothetical protein [Bacteroidia bacterium]
MTKNNLKGKITFTKNWNQKLQCDYFTTIRRYPKKIGQTYNIYLQDTFLFEAVVIDCQPITLNQLTHKTYLCYLDTGMSPQDTVNLLQKMYPSNNDTMTLYVVLLKRRADTSV